MTALPRSGIAPDAEAVGRLQAYYEYLEERNKVMNLTAISGPEDVARLHFLDCAALLTVCDFADKKVIDVGTGAGFPGLVLKIVQPEHGYNDCLTASISALTFSAR